MKALIGTLILLGASLVGCNRDALAPHDPTIPDAWPPAPADAGEPCASLGAKVHEWVATHSGCTVDSDCIGTPAFGPLFTGPGPPGPDSSCWPPEAIAATGRHGFFALLEQFGAAKCLGSTQLCTALIPAAYCRSGVCSLVQ
jgi:hypothetical protein